MKKHSNLNPGKVSSKKHPYLDPIIATNLKKLRKAKGMSQQNMANSLGVSFQAIQKYERGASRISASNLYLLSKTLDVPMTYFFTAR